MKIHNKSKSVSSSNKVLIMAKVPTAGGGTFINSLSKIKDKRLQLFFFCYERPSKRLISFKNIRYINTTAPSHPFLTISKIRIFISNLFSTYRLIKQQNPKIIISTDIYSLIILHVLNFFSTSYILLFRVGNNIQKYTSSKPGFLYRFILSALLKYAIRKTKFFIFISDQGRSNFLENYPISLSAKTYVVYHGINLSKATYLGNQKLSRKDSKVFDNNNIKIISVGRFEEQKDFETIIKAFSIAQKKISSIRLLLIGNGSLKKSLKSKVRNLKINRYVYFQDWQENVYPYLNHSDIFVYSSKYEGFGYVIIEAMSQRLPIIATNTPYGPSEILDKGKYGILINVGDYKRMAEKMVVLAKDKNIREIYERAAYSRVQFFQETKMLQQYQNLLLDLINLSNR